MLSPRNKIAFEAGNDPQTGSITSDGSVATRRHAVFAGGQLGICAEIVGRGPKIILDLFNVFQNIFDLTG